MTTGKPAIFTGIAVTGPASLKVAVERLLNELRAKAPEQYAEALKYVPSLVFDPERLSREHAEFVAARADGVFAIDGTHYEYFRWVFLHEVGHKVALANGLGNSEWPACQYADEVVELLRVPKSFS